MWSRRVLGDSWRRAATLGGGASAAFALFGYSGSGSTTTTPVQSSFPTIQVVYPEKTHNDVLVARRIVNDRDQTGLGIRLYQYETCPFCCKVRAFLDYYGLSYEVVEVNPVTRAQIKFSKDYKKVPIVRTQDEHTLTDSSLIISQLATFLTRPEKSIDEVLGFYPTSSLTGEHPSRYFIMQEKILSNEAMNSAKEEREWREWVDSHFVHLISPNVYGTWAESLETFKWFENVGDWHRTFPTWERILAVYAGAAAMYMIAGRLKKKHNIEDARESMKKACKDWAAQLNGRNFLGGEKPNLADLALYGALNSFRMDRRRGSSQMVMTPTSASDSGYPRTGTGYSSKQNGHRPRTPTRSPAHYLAGPVPVKSGVVASGSDGCLQRVPYASLMACCLCLIGVTMFAIMMAWAFNASVEQTRRALHIQRWHWLDRIQVFFVALAVIMGLFSLFLLAIGVLSTGATREEIFTGPRARCGGRVACAIALIISYILTGFWLVILSMTAILCFVYYVFDDVCRALPAYTEADCLDFSVFRSLVSDFSDATLKFCGGDAEQFCALSSTASSWYIVGWVGSLAVVAGLVHFLLTHAANYAHVSNQSRYVELRDVILDEQQAWNDPANHYNHYTIGPPPPSVRPPSPPMAVRKPGPPSTSTRAAQYSDGISDYAYGRRKGGYPSYH